MKLLRTLAVVLLAAGLLLPSFAAEADQYVRGYTKKDGTYVQPHYRSSPNKSYNDNWSVRGNTNPYTGVPGTKSPTYNDRPPSGNQNIFGSPQTQPKSPYIFGR